MFSNDEVEVEEEDRFDVTPSIRKNTNGNADDNDGLG